MKQEPVTATHTHEVFYETEWRVVCANHGTAGHADHTWKKKDLKKARQSIIDLNHHAEIHPTSFYAREAPYVLQHRKVGYWVPTPTEVVE